MALCFAMTPAHGDISSTLKPLSVRPETQGFSLSDLVEKDAFTLNLLIEFLVAAEKAVCSEGCLPRASLSLECRPFGQGLGKATNECAGEECSSE